MTLMIAVTVTISNATNTSVAGFCLIQPKSLSRLIEDMEAVLVVPTVCAPLPMRHADGRIALPNLISYVQVWRISSLGGNPQRNFA